jgi:hypothetical protein
MAAIIRNRLGFALRETGQALERLGCIWQGINSYEEESKQRRRPRRRRWCCCVL